MAEKFQHEEKLSGQESRQGKPGKPALYVLILSLVLAAVAIVGLMQWQSASSPPDYASQSQAASRKTVTGSETGGASGDAPSSTGSVPAADTRQPGPR